MLQNKHNEVAEFLLNAKGLSKFAIGEYLSDRNEFNQKVLLEFTNSFKFAGLPIDKAMRNFFCSFRLPGEALQV